MNLSNMILLDNQSACDLFCNGKLISQAWKTERSMTVQGNNGETLTTNMKTHVESCGEVWFDANANAITKILSLKNVPFHVTCDSHDGKGAFVAHKPNGIDVHFKCTSSEDNKDKAATRLGGKLANSRW
jgi:hypothetical protein